MRHQKAALLEQGGCSAFTSTSAVIMTLFFFCVCMELVLMLMLLYTDKFVVQGIKINTPHYLAKLPKISKGTSTYTVIVSQLDSLSTIYYTLRVRTYIMLYFILL